MDESMGVIILEPVHDFFSKIFKVYKNFLSREEGGKGYNIFSCHLLKSSKFKNKSYTTVFLVCVFFTFKFFSDMRIYL